MKSEINKKANAEKYGYDKEHNEERRKELFEKRKYYREHPKEAMKEASKNFDGH